MPDAQTIEDLLAQLGDANSRVRREACQAAGSQSGRRAVDGVAARLTDADAEVRAAAATALGDLGDIHMADRLIACLEDRDNSVRSAAAGALGKLGDTRAVEPLIRNSQDLDSRMVREASCAALGELRDLSAVEILVNYLAPKKLKSWVDEHVAFEALRKIFRDRPVTLLLAQLDSDHLLRSRVAAERTVLIGRLCALLGDRGDAAAVPALIQVLGKWDGPAAASASEALGRLGDSRAVEPLLTRTRDADADIRRNACEALGRLRDPRAVEALIQRLGDKEIRVRLTACVALGEIGDPQVAAALTALLGEPLELARVAGQTLAKLDGGAASGMVLHVIGALEGKDESIQELGRLAAAGDLGMVPLLLKHWHQHRSDRARKALEAISISLNRIIEGVLCPVCLTGLHPMRLGARVDSQIDWFACRTCGKLPARLMVGVREIVAVLDRNGGAEVSFVDGVLRVNWFERRCSCDFDKVDVIDADDAQVEGFCQEAGGGMAVLHATRPKRVPCTVGPRCALSRNTLKNLRSTFGPIVTDDPAGGGEERPEEHAQGGGWFKKLFAK